MHGLIAAILLWGLGAPLPRIVEEPLKLFEIAPPPPEPPVISTPPPRRPEPVEAQRSAPGREGPASPPNLRSEATQIVAPPPVVRLPVPTPIIAAPEAGFGNDVSTGRADVRGPGTGSGGFGDGRGSGTGGDGDGGGGYGRRTPPRHIRGHLSDRDYPRWAGEQGVGGTVSVRFTVALDGRAVNCRITRSSGSAELDAITCGLIERRYRYEPSRDHHGRPVLSDVVEDHEWVTYDEPPDPRRDY